MNYMKHCTTFCSNIKTEKRDFLSPMILKKKAVNVTEKKPPESFLCTFFNRNNDPIRQPY